MEDNTYDVVVTGAGPAGENVADRVPTGVDGATISLTGRLAVIGP